MVLLFHHAYRDCNLTSFEMSLNHHPTTPSPIYQLPFGVQKYITVCPQITEWGGFCVEMSLMPCISIFVVTKNFILARSLLAYVHCAATLRTHITIMIVLNMYHEHPHVITITHLLPRWHVLCRNKAINQSMILVAFISAFLRTLKKGYFLAFHLQLPTFFQGEGMFV